MQARSARKHILLTAFLVLLVGQSSAKFPLSCFSGCTKICNIVANSIICVPLCFAYCMIIKKGIVQKCSYSCVQSSCNDLEPEGDEMGTCLATCGTCDAIADAPAIEQDCSYTCVMNSCSHLPEGPEAEACLSNCAKCHALSPAAAVDLSCGYTCVASSCSHLEIGGEAMIDCLKGCAANCSLPPLQSPSSKE